jgi:hypothetical protein
LELAPQFAAFLQKWNVSEPTVRKYCWEGMILNAEKSEDNGQWQIPNDAEKPLLSRHQVRTLLDIMQSIQGGVKMSLSILECLNRI